MPIGMDPGSILIELENWLIVKMQQDYKLVQLWLPEWYGHCRIQRKD